MSEHQKAIALELTRIYYQTACSKNVPLEHIGKVDQVYLDILQGISDAPVDVAPSVPSAPEITSA
jgi:hypothetical protein